MEKVFIGVDVSKLTLDLFVKSNEIEQHYQIKNEVKAIRKFLKSFENESGTVIAMENTGRYNFALYEVLASTKLSVYVINALHLKRSVGLVRGKNDSIDSQRICTFIERNFMDLELWNASSIEIQKLSLLNAERRHRVKIRAGLRNQLKDAEQLKNIADKDVTKLNKQLILTLDKQIKSIEDKIFELINSNEELKSQYDRIQSIPGVGKVLATLMIIKTKGFSDIKSARKMACYAGVAPFEYSSGSSIYRKPRVSTMADKELKKVLHLAALSSIRLKNDLAIYFQRKVAEGKNKMCILNAIRNKIIHRIYALIKNESAYNFNLHMS
ncbi:IS110 family transposase [Soonwooa sp.]|uniref:IS110 family transposase n=1 Tax=Soonwooa sp. TaxID=1938592 RepID=UPI00262EEE5D|nr:IS110 family transposase [Soonwooa sp.]